MVSDVQTVQGVWLVGPGKVEVAPVKITPPKPDQVQIEMKACGICTGDVFRFHTTELEAHRFQEENETYPTLFGHEGVGVVRAIGSEVTKVEPGDKVALLGRNHYAQLVNLPETKVFKIPAGTEAFELWILEPLACVVNGLESAQIRPGDRVLLIGCGFMGNLLLQGLKRTLASEVMVAEVDPLRLELARKYQPTDSFNIGEAGELERLRAYAQEHAFDVVIEVAGAEPALSLAGDVLRRGGSLVMFSWQHGSRMIDTTQWHLGGFKVYNASPFISENFGGIGERTIRLLEKDVFDLRPLLTHVTDFRSAQAIFEAAAVRKDGYIKGVLLF